MLNAAARRKSGEEDRLTSSVFGLMTHLPHAVAWTLIRQAVYEPEELPEESGPLLEIDFWPRWSAEGTYNKYSVEPDVFMRFERFDLIVEAKRHDDKQQYSKQWHNQIKAYRNEYGDEDEEGEGRPVHHLAIGGINSEATQKVEGVSVYKTRWKQLVRQVKETQAAHDRKADEQAAAVGFVLDDLVTACGLFGYWHELLEWFETMPKTERISAESVNLLAQPVKFDSERWFASTPDMPTRQTSLEFLQQNPFSPS